ncbi:MAG: acetyl-CoA carboxylase biotin carboxylase subunit [Deltaproteobacteria bacterium]|nr:acetyl-CoA carboxylase biotin carboxylase subunit [Deltaproteobacteria bacterium]
MFERILIANRGEIALRVIRACKQLGIESVAVFSEADADSPHLRHADKTVCIGAAKSSESYLNMTAVLQAAEQTESKAIHPGYGFLSENALFAELCQQCKFTWIGPPPGAIRLMGDKATARRTMQAAGLPVIPGSEGVVASQGDALELAREIGFPVLLKATAGGGGKGMRICRDEQSFAENFEQASLESASAFGNAGLYLEKYIEPGRHIEFQFLADAFGNVVHLGERECSVQRQHQKLIEESPSPAIDDWQRSRIGEMVCRGVHSIGYVGAGTMEFLRDPGGNFYFLEVNTRLQVEHPVTEMVTGHDIVHEQIKVAANHILSVRQEAIRLTGHTIECRIYAEDPAERFRPCPGQIEQFEPPREIEGIRLRVDTHVQPGYRIPIYYDSLICKLIAWAEDREAARRGMLAALRQFKVTGIKTTIPAHLRVLESQEFTRGEYDTSLIGRLLQ